MNTKRGLLWTLSIDFAIVQRIKRLGNWRFSGGTGSTEVLAERLVDEEDHGAAGSGSGDGDTTP